MLIFSWEEFPIILCKVRRSHQEMFYKKVVIKSFAKSTEKTCARAFFKRSLRLEASNFIVTEATVKAYICTSVHLQMVVSVGVLQNYLPKIFVDKFLQSRQEVCNYTYNKRRHCQLFLTDFCVRFIELFFKKTALQKT